VIIWSGWGVLVIVILVVVGGGVAAIIGALFGSMNPDMAGNFGIGAGALAAAAMNWWAGRRLNGGTGRVLLDPTTGQQVVLRRSHSLFFIPMQWWSVPMLVFGLFLLGVGLFGKKQFPAQPDQAPPRAGPL